MSIRVRKRVDLRPGLTYREDSIHTTCSHSTMTTGASSSRIWVGTRDFFEDTVVPSFHKRKASGEVFFNPMRSGHEEYTENYTDGEIQSVANSCTSPAWKAAYYVKGSQFSRVIDVSPTPEGYLVPACRWNGTAASYNTLIAEATTEMLAKRGNAPSNLWESVAEARKTAEMLNRPLAQLIKRLQKVVRARGIAQKARSFSTIAPDYWLMYRYGIIPLLKDIEQTISGLNKEIGKVRTTSRGNIKNDSVVTENRTNAIGVMNIYSSLTTTESVLIRAMSLDEYVATVGSNLGFTLKGLLTVPWELASYSFVADWVVNVGDYLNAITPALGYTALGSCYTADIKRQTIWSITGVTSNHSGYSIVVPISGMIAATVNTKERCPIPAAKLVIKNDFGFDKLTRQADAAALIAQLVLRAFAPPRLKNAGKSNPTRVPL